MKEDCKMDRIQHYKQIADLFRYPSESLLSQSEEFEKLIQTNYTNEISKCQLFLNHVQTKSLRDLQEYYVSTFDIQALSHLDIGYILFGEDLKRGDFLVKLQQEHIKNKTDLGFELADHLPNVLVLLASTNDSEFADEFVQFILLPALLSMIKGFKSESNVYLFLLQILKEVLIKDFNIEEIKIEIPENKDCVFAGNGCSANNTDNY
ncbi:MAG: hypothetical protein HOD63_09490 [Bacteroidetes bacterium]|jgi:nitrate reductase molybdenum cofactor assembly chaperone|nr:hypothetical protein [Bacteroidota bacterium]MBT4338812.1 hypothetical protein [Bacteroidota bacterium]MBT5992399.1 hypothetical protein [Bacteroidota bacterium]